MTTRRPRPGDLIRRREATMVAFYGRLRAVDSIADNDQPRLARLARRRMQPTRRADGAGYRCNWGMTLYKRGDGWWFTAREWPWPVRAGDTMTEALAKAAVALHLDQPAPVNL